MGDATINPIERGPFERELAGSDSKGLSALIGLNERIPQWSASDLSSILLHQLAAPLQTDLSVLGPDAPRMLQRFTAASPNACQTFRDVLCSDDPPVELLVMIKDYARLTGKDQSLPNEIASALYYASILAATSRCGKRISNLSESALNEGANWMIATEWIEPALRLQLSRDLRRLTE